MGVDAEYIGENPGQYNNNLDLCSDHLNGQNVERATILNSEEVRGKFLESSDRTCSAWLERRVDYADGVNRHLDSDHHGVLRCDA